MLLPVLQENSLHPLTKTYELKKFYEKRFLPQKIGYLKQSILKFLMKNS